MSTIEVGFVENASAETREEIIGGLVSFNDQHAGPALHTELLVVASVDGELAGGLVGYTNWEWLFIAQLWVAPAVRGQKVGARLLAAAETEARQRGCKHAHVDTFSFQAVPFYERFGYAVFGSLENYPEGHTRYFLQKRQLHDGAAPDSS